jgi:Sec7-like guanine-nucleotide exchange factor
MDTSGHAHLILLDSNHRNRSLITGGGWTEDEDRKEILNEESGSDRCNSEDNKDDFSVEAANMKYKPITSNNTGAKHNLGSVKLRRAAHQESEELIKEAINIYNQKKSIKKAVDYLISKNFMADTPQEIVNFLRVYKNSFDPISIGEFLGEGGVSSTQMEYWAQIRFRYTRAVSFVEMDLEPALRLYLTGYYL